MIKPNKNIKKLSTAILRGYAIAKERGIKIARGELFRTNKKGEITCACAMGLAAIGKYGVKEATNFDSARLVALDFDQKLEELNPCMAGKTKVSSWVSPYQAVMILNDDRKKNPEQIVEVLKECKF